MYWRHSRASVTGLLTLTMAITYLVPVLHFFSSRHREVAIAPNVAALDEGLATVVVDSLTCRRV